MQNKRLTIKNQYGDILYCGPRNNNSYRNMGIYAEDMDKDQIELILSKLYLIEELIDDLQEQLIEKEKTIELMERFQYNAE